MHTLKILVKQLDPDLPVPQHATPGDAGVDLYAREGGTVWSGERKMVPTGIAVAIPDGYVGLIAPRSGLAVKYGISLVNAPGILDSGFRGEIHAIVINEGEEAFTYERGDRIAQLVVVPFAEQQFEVVEDLPDSARGEGGFGSTGS